MSLLDSYSCSTCGGPLDAGTNGHPCPGGPPEMTVALALVRAERLRQEKLWAGQTAAAAAMQHAKRLAILAEEFGEVAHELTEAMNAGDIESPGRAALRDELAQVAAVAVAWIEALL